MLQSMDDIPKNVVIDFLAASEFFSDIKTDVLEQLVLHLKPVFLSGGEILMNEGDSGDSLYLVVNGRLRAFRKVAGGNKTMLGEMGAGEIIGELALLTEQPRAATVYAIRDSLVLKLTKNAFDEFCENHHTQLMSIVKHAIIRIMTKNLSATAPINTITIAPAGNSLVYKEFTHQFIEAISTLGDTLHLNSKKFDEYLHEPGFAQTPLESDRCTTIANWLSEQENKYKFIVYETDEKVTPWSRRCLRQADRILLIAASEDNHELNEVEHEISSFSSNIKRTTDLILIHGSDVKIPKETAKWLELRDVESHHHVQIGNEKTLQRVIRYITGKNYALVLGGGGARGLAHLGAYRALQELGIEIDLVAGTSAGAMMAGLFAMDYDVDTISDILKTHLVSNKKLFDYTVPVVSIISAKAWSKSLMNAYGREVNIEDLWKRMFCISTNITKREIKVHSQGILWKNVRASLSLPGIVPPISTKDGDLLIDGCIVNNLPVDVMRRFSNGGKIIAVNVSSKPELTSDLTPEGWLSGWGLLRQQFNPFRKVNIDIPTISEIIFESITLCSMQHQRRMAREADYYIDCDVREFKLFDFKQIDNLSDIGYESTLSQLKDKLSS